MYAQSGHVLARETTSAIVHRRSFQARSSQATDGARPAALNMKSSSTPAAADSGVISLRKGIELQTLQSDMIDNATCECSAQ